MSGRPTAAGGRAQAARAHLVLQQEADDWNEHVPVQELADEVNDVELAVVVAQVGVVAAVVAVDGIVVGAGAFRRAGLDARRLHGRGSFQGGHAERLAATGGRGRRGEAGGERQGASRGWPWGDGATRAISATWPPGCWLPTSVRMLGNRAAVDGDVNSGLLETSAGAWRAGRPRTAPLRCCRARQRRSHRKTFASAF